MFKFIPFLFLFSHLNGKPQNRTFQIDYGHNQFLKDGHPYRYISASIHYPRVPIAYWNDRLSKIKAAGLNAIQFYIPWNYHERKPGQFDFSDNANVSQFVQLAQKNGLDVIVRMGPFSGGEMDSGGLPWWILKLAPKSTIRTKDPLFLYYVTKWYFRLFPIILPLLYKNGGPIIMLQVENEYGSNSACDREYMAYLRDLFRSYVGEDVVLFTVDGGSLGYLKCGYTPGLYPTVDFGVGDRQSIRKSFAAQRAYAPRGPLVNTESYPGWLDVWGLNHSTVATTDVRNSMISMYELGASFNFYMFHGGTTFGYWNGAIGIDPCTTSYDYDAPLNEAADPTLKYVQIRRLIENLTGIHNTYPLPMPNPKRAYGQIGATLIGSLIDLLDIWSDKKVNSKYPLTFEQLDFPYGFVLYQTILNDHTEGNLSIEGVRDRGYVMIDGQMEGIVSNIQKIYHLTIKAQKNQKLQILVENQGRHNQGGAFKGIVANVTLDGKILSDWIQYPIDIQDLFLISQNLQIQSSNILKSSGSFTPSFYVANFSLDDQPEDTFFQPANWTKGIFFLNHFNLGRYWPSLGPQVTLYIPKTVLKQGTNLALMFELEKPGNCQDSNFTKCAFHLIDTPILNKTVTG